MAELKRDHKIFIVTRLACHYRPSEVRDEFKQKFKSDITLQQICYYDPLTAQGHDQNDEEWKDLFETTRKAFNDKMSAIPIADRYYHLFRLQQLIDDELFSRSPKTVMNALEQAAKVMGMYAKPEEPKGGADPHAPNLPLYDMSKISRAELDTVESILAKAAIADGDTGGTGAA